jgi:hypothetical protein
MSHQVGYIFAVIWLEGSLWSFSILRQVLTSCRAGTEACKLPGETVDFGRSGVRYCFTNKCGMARWMSLLPWVAEINC